MNTIEHMQATVHRYVEAFKKEDINLIREIFAENATVEDPVGTDIKHGMGEIVAFYEQGLKSGAKLTLTQSIRVAGNSAAFAFEVKFGEMIISPIDVFEFNDEGKVQSMKAYWGQDNIQS